MRDYQSDDTKPFPIEKLMDEFEPEGDTALDKLDRRLLYEVTGLRLVEDEFKDQNSSSESDSNSDDSNG